MIRSRVQFDGATLYSEDDKINGLMETAVFKELLKDSRKFK